MKKFTSDNFGLAVLDSGCNVTVCGKEWLSAYLESLNSDELKKVTYQNSSINFRFGDNKPTVSTKQVCFPSTVCKKEVKIKAEVVDDRIPLLISNKTMERARMVLNYGDYTVTAFGHTQKMIRTESGHCSIPITKKNIYEHVCLCSQDNIMLYNGSQEKDKKKLAEKLHKQFAHPTSDRLKELLKTSKRSDKELFKEIDEYTKTCEICIRYKRPEPRPIVCMPLAREFNDTVSMDLKIYDGKKGIYFQHMIDHLTRFSTAKVIKSKDKEVIIESVFTHWISIFGRPKTFMSDNGGEYNNLNFIEMCEKLGTHVVTTGAEAPWSNGLVERHHTLLARNVDKIMEETDCSLETALAWAVNAKNILSNINGFSPYQLLLGVNPKFPSLSNPYEYPTTLEQSTTSEKVAEHIKALYSARKQQMAVEADEKIKRALSHNTRDVYSKKIEPKDKVFYKREASDRWKGPAVVIGIDGKVVFLRQGGIPIKCHITRVCKVNDIFDKHENSDTVKDPPTPNDDGFSEAEQTMMETLELQNDEESYSNETDETDPTIPTEPDISKNTQALCNDKDHPGKKKVPTEATKGDPFIVEKRQELNKWKEYDVYEELDVNQIEEIENLNPISVTWNLKEKDGKKKARLVARGYQEEALNPTETVSPTCRKESLRILLSITASKKWTIKSIDVTSAFLQGKEIERDVYLIPPKEHGKKDTIWKLKKCVYGLSDAAKIWYTTVKEQIEAANIQKCPYDEAFFYWSERSGIDGTMTVHVDDFIYSGTNKFETILTNSLLDKLQIGTHFQESFTYLGLEVEQVKETKAISISQHKYIDNLKQIELSPKRRNQKTHALNNEEHRTFREKCGQLLWLSLQTRPDISYDVCQLSNHVADPNVQDIITLNKVIKKLKQDPEMKLSFQSINLDNLTLLVYADAAYANLPHHGSQCGYIVFMSDAEEISRNPIAWKSTKIDRVCQSALAAEGLSLVKAVDHAIFIQTTIQQMLKCEAIPIKCFTDSKSLYEILLRTKDPEEKKLICAVAPIRDSIEKGEITIERINSKQMPADILTKRGVNSSTIRYHLLNDPENHQEK